MLLTVRSKCACRLVTPLTCERAQRADGINCRATDVARRIPWPDGTWTARFLATTALTSATGFLFPVDRLLRSHSVGAISLGILAVAPRQVGPRAARYECC